MKFLIEVAANPVAGQGSWVRCSELARVLIARGHVVFSLSERDPGAGGYFFKSSKDPADRSFAGSLRPDWVISPDLDSYIRPVPSFRFMLLPESLPPPEVWSSYDVIVVQDVLERRGRKLPANILGGTDWVLLREELVSRPRNVTSDWVVWGGSSNEPDLLSAFSRAMPAERAWLVGTPWMEGLIDHTSHHKFRMLGLGELPMLLSRAKAACLRMGAAVWESIRMGVPTFVFPVTEAERRSALALEKMGLVSACRTLYSGDVADVFALLHSGFPVPLEPDCRRIGSVGWRGVLSILESPIEEKVGLDSGGWSDADPADHGGPKARLPGPGDR